MRDAGLEKNACAYAALLQNNAAQPPLRRYIHRNQLRQVVPLADTTIWEMSSATTFRVVFF